MGFGLFSGSAGRGFTTGAVCVCVRVWGEGEIRQVCLRVHVQARERLGRRQNTNCEANDQRLLTLLTCGFDGWWWLLPCLWWERYFCLVDKKEERKRRGREKGEKEEEEEERKRRRREERRRGGEEEKERNNLM